MKTSLKNFLILFFSISSANFLFAFDWPQKEVNQDSICSYYGQYRGGSISSSLIFSDPDFVTVSENGRILVIMPTYNDDTDFFPSALGTAVIVVHDDSLATVYGNLDSDNFGKATAVTDENDESVDYDFNEFALSDNIEKGSVIAATGNTAWQQSMNSLEYQILDLKNSSTINPRVLLPRTTFEQVLQLENLILKNKNNETFALSDVKSIPTGIYKIYNTRNSIAIPYRSSVYVNGIPNDTINYDLVYQNNNKIIIKGKHDYNKNDLYPDDSLHLLGEIVLTPGKSTVTIEIADILNNVVQATYNISAY